MRRRTISAMEARKHFGELLESVYYRGDAVTIERAGKPMAVMLSLSQFKHFNEQKGNPAWDRLWNAVDRIHAVNADADPEQVEADVAAALKSVRAEQ